MRLIAFAPVGPSRSATIAAAVLAAGHDWWRRYRDWQRRRATARVLHGLSDRTLKDIGIDRSEIESVALSGADRRCGRLVGPAVRR